MPYRRSLSALCVGAMLSLAALSLTPSTAHADGYHHGGHGEPPNILFVILDDAGFDQMTLYGNGGDNPPILPNIDRIAHDGVAFSNAWAMPECSPSRATFFTGRLPFRTGVTSAILPQMLAAAQVSPYENTLPRLLRTQKNYRSAMIGKYHLGNNNPSGNCSPATRGFDHFDGNMEAGPPSIDTFAGSPPDPESGASGGPQDCGFYSDSTVSGEPIGACYFNGGRRCDDGYTGKECLEAGGLLALHEECRSRPPSEMDFDRTNGFYVWPDTINDGSLPAPTQCDRPAGTGCANLVCSDTNPPTTSRGDVPINREYMTRYQTQAGVDWWRAQRGPRMLTVSYNAIHTPYQQPPGVTMDEDDLLCRGADSDDPIQEISNLMFEDMDQEIGQLLQALNLATLNDEGQIHRLHLDRENTLLVIIGDNGTYQPNVRPPGSSFLAKGTVWQTGVWVPLIAAGPQVRGRRGRFEDALVNSVDLFELFSEAAGIDPREHLPPAHRLDSKPLLPYLQSPRQTSPIRPYNFSEIQPGGTLPTPVSLGGKLDPASSEESDRRLWPCVLFANAFEADGTQCTLEEAQNGGDQCDLSYFESGTCQDLLFDTEEFCESNQGVFFGPGTSYPNPNADERTPDGAWFDCCDVIEAFAAPPDSMARPVAISPVAQRAARNVDFKVIEQVFPDCSDPLTADDIEEAVDNSRVFPPYHTVTSHSFYTLDTPDEVDRIPEELCRLTDLILAGQEPEALKCAGTTGSVSDNCANAPACLIVPVPVPGVGPIVTQTLRDNYDSLLGTISGVVQSGVECLGDGNLDKRVNQLDLDGWEAFRGLGKSYYDINKDGFTDLFDRHIIEQNLGSDCLNACRRADLNQDNLVNQEDVQILKANRGPCDIDLAAESHLCNADINGDGVINNKDLELLNQQKRELDGQACPIVVHAVTEDDIDCEDCSREERQAAIVRANQQNIQNAFDEAALLGNGRVQLVGDFDLRNCSACVVIRGPMIVQGTGDPSGDKPPNPADVTIIRGGNSSAPFTINWDIDYFDGPIIVEKLWFNGGIATALIMEQTRGTVKLLNNRVTGLDQIGPDPGNIFPFRFGLAGAGFGPFRGQFNGAFHAVGNFIRNPIRNFSEGDDNGVAISNTNFDFIEISHNTLLTRGESVEIENNIAPGGRIEIVGNKIRTDAAISNFAGWTFMPPPPEFFPTGESGGHPACIKVTGGEMAHLLVEDNDVETKGYPSVVCIMVGLNNDDSRTIIRGNRCSMDGSFAGILAGWAGEIPFFPPFYLQNALVEHNILEGTPRFGILFMDWTFDGPGPDEPNFLTNFGTHNLFRWNDMSGLHASDAALVFWTSTSNNRFFGDPNGRVIDRGTNNIIANNPGFFLRYTSFWWWLYGW